MTRPAVIPAGTWPPRMGAELSAGYCGEPSVESFLRRVGRREYPQPAVKQGRRQLWLKADLDQAILPSAAAMLVDVAEDL